MASLVHCEKCGKEKSQKVKGCPHCGHRVLKPSETYPCRTCGKLLEKAIYRAWSSSTYQTHFIQDGSSHIGTGIAGGATHSPCPNCGEPKPLFRMIWFTIFTTVIGLALTGGCVVLGVSQMNDRDARYIILSLVVAWIVVFWFINRVQMKHTRG
jgi:hypothetical protein